MNVKAILNFLLIFLLIGLSAVVEARNKSEKMKWLTKSDTLEAYQIQFKYPNYYSCEWVEGVLIINSPSRNRRDDFKNWGIFVWDYSNFPDVSIDRINDSFYLEKFKNDLLERRDTLEISGFKALRITRSQRYGKLYSQYILIELDVGILVIFNENKESNDFTTFCKSVVLRRLTESPRK